MDSQLFTLYFLEHFLVNTVSMIILLRGVYYVLYRKSDFFFPFFLLNLIVFLLCFIIEKSHAFASIGTAFGLMAAFSLLRFRTESISIKDMTYLFIVMTLGLINSIMAGSWVEIIALNVLIIGFSYLIDGTNLLSHQQSKIIEYTGTENIRPEKQTLLIADLRERTGLNIQSISIEHIDLSKNKIVVKIYYQ